MRRMGASGGTHDDSGFSRVGDRALAVVGTFMIGAALI
jgi:hypothetical protein